MSKKRIAAMLAAAMMLSQTGVFAQETVSEAFGNNTTIVQPWYVALNVTDYSFSISGGTTSCFGKTTVRDSYKAKTIVELQKKNSSWSTIKTWTKTGTSTVANVDQDYAVSSGTYRIKVTHQALSGSTVVEEKITYSGEVTK